MGFQHMPEVVHRAASGKGGRIRTDKGLASIDVERRREIASMGGKARHENRSKERTKQAQGNPGGSPQRLADVSGDIDEKEL